MLALLPFLSLVLFYRVGRLHGLDLRMAVMAAFGVFGATVALGTELLSLFSAITLGGLLMFWGVVVLVSGILCFKIKAVTKNEEAGEHEPWTWTLLLVIAGVVVVFVILGVIAGSFAPSNSDSMVYHMARVVYWQQNGSVHPYPTAIATQIVMSPLAEYVILHLQILSGTDRFANFVQWFAALGCVLGVSLIAGRLGAKRHGQVLASVLCMAIPMGIFQATSTQNDYVLALWMVVIACWAPLTRADAINTRLAGWLGVLLGLAVLTKGTSFFYAGPFVVLFVVLAVLKLRWRSWPVLLIPTITCLLIIFGHYFRNYVLFDSALAASPGLSNDVLGLHPLISNLIRNAAFHLATPSDWLSGMIEEAVRWFHNLFGWDVNDPAVTFIPHVVPFRMDFWTHWASEDSAPNPVHAILIGIAWLCALLLKPLRTRKPLVIYGVVVAFGLVFFCALLKWQIWGSRLLMSFFVLMVPFVATTLSALPVRRLVNVLMIALLLYAGPHLVYNDVSPLESIYDNHDRGYFRNRPHLSKPYREMTDLILTREYTRLGMISSARTWEYPLLALLHQDGRRVPYIEHVGLRNPTSQIRSRSGKPAFEPDAILLYRTTRASLVPLSYVLLRENSHFRLYEKR